MNTVIRRIAVSGSAAAALLGGAAAITVAYSGTASATEIQAHIDRATGAPVTMPDGRTVHIRGLDTAGRPATAEHHTAVVTLASYKADPNDPAGITNGLTADNGSGSALQNPLNSGTIPASTPQQITTQAGGGTISVGIVSILVLAIIVFVKVKHSGLKVADAVLGALFGIAIAGTTFGAMGNSLTNSVVGSLSSMLGNLG
ncbi:hypothetical protein ACWD3J_14020 [Streptomyces sp. NPDC002755]